MAERHISAYNLAIEKRSFRITRVSLRVIVADLVALIAIASSLGTENGGQLDDVFPFVFFFFFFFSRGAKSQFLAIGTEDEVQRDFVGMWVRTLVL
jgi:hypothetical protein